MAIGTAAAIGLGVVGIGSAVSASSNRSAARTAANASQAATAASVGLQRDIYNQNRQTMQPFVQRGNAAGETINALLGLGGAPMQAQPQPNAMSQFSGFDPGQQFPFMPEGAFPNQRFSSAIPAAARYGVADGQAGLGTPFAANPQGGQTAREAADNAFDIFRNSTGYRFRVDEGTDAVNSGFAGSGLLQSGDALRALDDYRQGMASAEFGNFMGLLGQQQAVGAGSASSLAGVGQNFASNAGNLIMNNAGNQANAAIARAQNNPFANLFGTVGGGLLGYGR